MPSAALAPDAPGLIGSAPSPPRASRGARADTLLATLAKNLEKADGCGDDGGSRHSTQPVTRPGGITKPSLSTMSEVGLAIRAATRLALQRRLSWHIVACRRSRRSRLAALVDPRPVRDPTHACVPLLACNIPRAPRLPLGHRSLRSRLRRCRQRLEVWVGCGDRCRSSCDGQEASLHGATAINTGTADEGRV